MKVVIFISLLILAPFFAGCAPSLIKEDGFLYPPAVVAVLPLVNDTNDVNAPEYIRNIISKKLKKRGYRVVESWRVDEVLRSSSVTLGHQVRHLDKQELGRRLGVDGLFYGTLKDFSFRHVVFAGLRRVEVSLKLVNVQTGRVVWEANAEASGSGTSLAPLEKAMRSTPLSGESKEVVLKLIQKLPKR